MSSSSTAGNTAPPVQISLPDLSGRQQLSLRSLLRSEADLTARQGEASQQLERAKNQAFKESGVGFEQSIGLIREAFALTKKAEEALVAAQLSDLVSGVPSVDVGGTEMSQADLEAAVARMRTAAEAISEDIDALQVLKQRKASRGCGTTVLMGLAIVLLTAILV